MVPDITWPLWPCKRTHLKFVCNSKQLLTRMSMGTPVASMPVSMWQLLMTLHLLIIWLNGQEWQVAMNVIPLIKAIVVAVSLPLEVVVNTPLPAVRPYVMDGSSITGSKAEGICPKVIRNPPVILMLEKVFSKKKPVPASHYLLIFSKCPSCMQFLYFLYLIWIPKNKDWKLWIKNI